MGLIDESMKNLAVLPGVNTMPTIPANFDNEDSVVKEECNISEEEEEEEEEEEGEEGEEEDQCWDDDNYYNTLRENLQHIEAYIDEIESEFQPV